MSHEPQTGDDRTQPLHGADGDSAGSWDAHRTEAMPSNNPEDIQSLSQTVALEFRRRLEAGEDLRVEEYLDRYPRLMGAPSEVVELIVQEYGHRRKKSPGLAIDEYLDRFPMYRHWLSARLSNLSEDDEGQILFAKTDADESGDVERSATASNILQQLADRKIVQPELIEQVRASFGTAAQVSDQQVIDALLSQGRITPWQLKQLRAGQKTFLLEGGRYLLLEEIGRGGMGSVYRARHTRLNREVALKVIDPQNARNKELVARFRREIEISSRLQHEHIVHTYDMGQHEGVHFLVLEYLHGSDLASLVRRDGPMAPDEAAAIALQTAAALVYAHAQGIIHRDIKPHNILLSTEGVVKILDLGLAAVTNQPEAETVAQLTQSGVVLGTVDYMAPEQAADMHAVDGRSDIYSLGATLFFLLTGQPPFSGGALMNKLHKLANVQPPTVRELRPDCPQALSDVVQRMMAKDPNNRYQSTIDVLRALQPLAAERIAGRQAVTRSVQLASNTSAVAGQTAAPVSPFDFLSHHSVSISHTLQRHHRKNNRTAIWIFSGAIAAALVVGLGIWAVGRLGGGKSGNGDSGEPQDKNAAVTAGGKGSPDENRPPSEIRAIYPAHFSGIRNYSWAPDGYRFATASQDGTVRVWDVARLESRIIREERIPGHYLMRWSADGKWIAARGDQNTVTVFDSFTGEVRTELPFPVTGGFAFSPDGKEIAASTATGVVRWTFDIQRNPIPVTSRQGFEVRYSAKGRYLLVNFGDGDDSGAEVWEVGAAQGAKQVWKSPRLLRIRRVFGTSTSYVRPQVEVTADETQVVVAGDGKASFWKLSDGSLAKEFEIPKCGNRRNWHELSIGAKYYVVANDEGLHTVDLTLARPDRPAASVRVELPSNWEPRPGYVSGLLSPGGRHALFTTSGTGSSSSWLVDLQSVSRKPFGYQEVPPGGRDLMVDGLRFLRIDYDGSSKVSLDLWTGKPEYDIPNSPSQSFISHLGTMWVLSPGVDSGLPTQNCEIWPIPGSDVKSKQVLPNFEELEGFDRNRGWGWADGGEEVWIRSGDYRQVRFWKSRTGKVARTLPLQSGESATANPHGRLIVRRWVGQEVGNTARILRLTLNHVQDDGSLSEDVVIRHNRDNATLWISPDDRWIAARKDGNDRTLMVWDARTGKQHLSLIVDAADIWVTFRGTEFSPSGKYLIVGTQLWDLEASPPSQVWKLPEPVYASDHYGAGFVKDDRYLAVCKDAETQIWDWQNGKRLVTGYMLPDRQWLALNHQTGCWVSSSLAFRYFQFLHRPDAKKQEWVAPYVYSERSGWKNDEEQVGLQSSLKPD